VCVCVCVCMLVVAVPASIPILSSFPAAASPSWTRHFTTWLSSHSLTRNNTNLNVSLLRSFPAALLFDFLAITHHGTAQHDLATCTTATNPYTLFALPTAHYPRESLRLPYSRHHHNSSHSQTRVRAHHPTTLSRAACSNARKHTAHCTVQTLRPRLHP
jgi:hypothetical protein